MIAFLKILFVFLLVSGCLQMLDYIYKVPPASTARELGQAATSKKTIKRKIMDEAVAPMVKVIAPFIKPEDRRYSMILPEGKYLKLKGMLDRAGMKISPEEYYAKGLILSLLLLPLPFVLLIIGARVLMVFAALMIPMTFAHLTTSYKNELKRKQQQISLGMPGFIRSILYKIGETQGGVIKADLITIFEDYLQVANPVFAYDISILVMEMKIKNAENALRNFNARIAIPEVGFLCNALVGLTRGESQREALASLAREMDIRSKENIRKELDKRPGKVMYACIPLVLIVLVVIVYVLGYAIIQNAAIFS